MINAIVVFLLCLLSIAVTGAPKDRTDQCFEPDSKRIKFVWDRRNCNEISQISAESKTLKYVAERERNKEKNEPIYLYAINFNRDLVEWDTSDLSISEFETRSRTQNTAISNIRKWDASNNNIRELPKTFIENELPNLNEIDLSNNNFTSLPENAASFTYFANLQKIVLSGNSINEIGQRAFSKLKDLTHLDLSGNQITTLSEGLLESNTKLESLNLQGNPMKTFSYNVFAPSMPSLSSWLVKLPSSDIEILDVSCTITPGNGSVCPFRGFNRGDNFTKIQQFDASGNQLNDQDWLQCVERLGSTLEKLDLSHNKISGLTSETLQKFPKLTSIKLCHMNWSKLDFCAFRNQPQLQYLNVSHNRLEDIDNAYGSCKIKKLAKLDLTLNPLKNSQSIKNKFEDMNPQIDVFT